LIAEQFGVFELPPFAARFNIAPTQPVPVVRMRPAGRELVWLRWGLVPSWAKDPAIGNRLINARAETAAEKPAFRAALRRRRCLVAADGFYEWQKQQAGRAKQPYFIRLRDDRPFAFAGLWETWEAKKGTGPICAQHPEGHLGKLDLSPFPPRLETCTLLTTDANDLIRPLHDRMPVIIAANAYDAWLDPATEDPRQLAALLVPYPSDAMEAYPVGGLVNNPKNDSAGCIEPAAGHF
jgi:putative SOS response-associated peptidase YedK